MRTTRPSSRCSVNGRRVFSSSILAVEQISFSGGAGDDRLTVDSSHGAILIPGGVHFTGNDDQDEIVLTGGKVHSVTTTPNGNARTYRIEDTRGGATQTVVFEDFGAGTTRSRTT